MPVNDIEVDDHVITPSGNVHWVVEHIYSKIDPLGVLLTSGQTGRKRYESYENLVLFQKGNRHDSVRNRSAAADFLRENGIDPSDVFEDGIDSTGYFELHRGTGGNRVTSSDGTPERSWREWPTPEMGQALMAIYRGEI